MLPGSADTAMVCLKPQILTLVMEALILVKPWMEVAFSERKCWGTVVETPCTEPHSQAVELCKSHDQHSSYKAK